MSFQTSLGFYGVGWTTNTFVKQPKNEEESLLELTPWFSRSIYGHFNSPAIGGDLRWICTHRYGQSECLSCAQVREEEEK